MIHVYFDSLFFGRKAERFYPIEPFKKTLKMEHIFWQILLEKKSNENPTQKSWQNT